MDHLCYLCLVFFMLWCLSIDVLWSSTGKGWNSCLLFVMFNCIFLTFPCVILDQVWFLFNRNKQNVKEEVVNLD